MRLCAIGGTTGLTCLYHIATQSHLTGLQPILYWGFFAFILAAIYQLSAWIIQSYRKKPRKIIIVGAGDQGRRMSEMLQSESDIEIVAFFDDRLPSGRISHSVGDIPVLGTVEELIAYARHHEELDQLVIALPWQAEDRILTILGQLQNLPLKIVLGPDLITIGVAAPLFAPFDYTQMVTLSVPPLSSLRGLLKEAEDRLLGSVLFIACAPVMMLIALLIKLDSSGPVFFRQLRHGFNEKPFYVIKFRTMTHSPDSDPLHFKQATRNDARVTRLGYWLRRTSLDELPQLINVVQGDMSLVGPRPHPLAFNHEYADKINRYTSRHHVKPGITGLAQIHGYRGEIHCYDTIAARIRYDLEYINNWSLWMDLKILFLTPVRGLVHKNAY